MGRSACSVDQAGGKDGQDRKKVFGVSLEESWAMVFLWAISRHLKYALEPWTGGTPAKGYGAVALGHLAAGMLGLADRWC